MRFLPTIPAIASFAMAMPAVAAEWHAGAPSTLVATGDTEGAARAFVLDRGAELGLDGIELGAARVVRGVGAARSIRFEQAVDGVPVLGGGVVVRVDNAGAVRRVAVDVARALTVETAPSLTLEDAQAALARALGHEPPRPARSRLVVGRFGEGELLYELDVRDPLGGTRYLVDAHDGTLVSQRALALDVLGRVYASNAVETPVPVDVELMLLDQAPEASRLNGWSGKLAVANYLSGSSQNGFTLDQTLSPNLGGDFLYDPPTDVHDATDGFAQVNLYHHLTSMRIYYEGLGLDFSAASWKLTAVANAEENGQPLDNAFFSPMGIDGTFAAPNLIAIGQGSQTDFAYDSDVFNHEFGHYVSNHEIGYNLGQGNFDELGLSPWSGSVDEGIADYFACSKADDAELGEASLGLLGATRDLTDISKTCPDDMIGEVHADGELVGSFAWSLRSALGAQVADQLVWGSLSSMPAGGDFNDFAQGVLATAEDLVTTGTLDGEGIDTIEKLMADRGLDECGRVIPVAAGGAARGTLFGLDLIGQLFGQSCAGVKEFGIAIPSLFHYSFSPASNDTALRFSVAMTPSGGGDVEFTIWARASSPVGFSSGAGGFIPEVSAFDYKVAVTGPNGELVIDASTEPAFDPSVTYDFVVTSTSCPNLAMEVSMAAIPSPSLPGEGGGGEGAGGAPDGGAGGDSSNPEDVDDGCGCRVTVDDRPWRRSAFLAFGALLISIRRGAGRRMRRRRHSLLGFLVASRSDHPEGCPTSDRASM